MRTFYEISCYGSMCLFDISRNAIRNQCQRAIACIILVECVCGCCANTPMKSTRITCPKRTKCWRKNAVRTLAIRMMLKPVRSNFFYYSPSFLFFYTFYILFISSRKNTMHVETKFFITSFVSRCVGHRWVGDQATPANETDDVE